MGHRSRVPSVELFADVRSPDERSSRATDASSVLGSPTFVRAGSAGS